MGGRTRGLRTDLIFLRDWTERLKTITPSCNGNDAHSTTRHGHQSHDHQQQSRDHQQQSHDHQQQSRDNWENNSSPLCCAYVHVHMYVCVSMKGTP